MIYRTWHRAGRTPAVAVAVIALRPTVVSKVTLIFIRAWGATVIMCMGKLVLRMLPIMQING
jgi:hypothetical protein